MRILLVVLALSACGESRQLHRWPGHRREKDAQIEELVRKTTRLEAHVEQLEKLLRALQLQSTPAAPQPPP